MTLQEAYNRISAVAPKSHIQIGVEVQFFTPPRIEYKIYVADMKPLTWVDGTDFEQLVTSVCACLTDPKLASLDEAEALVVEAGELAQKPLNVELPETVIWHYMVNFRTVCGSDYPNLCRTEIADRVTCPACQTEMRAARATVKTGAIEHAVITDDDIPF